MQIFNVGALEFLLIFILALVLLGPDRMVETARGLGKWVYRLVRSPFWTSVMDTSRELRDLPTKIVREAGLEESIKEIKDINQEVKKQAGTKELNETVQEINREIRETAHLANQELLDNVEKTKGQIDRDTGEKLHDDVREADVNKIIPENLSQNSTEPDDRKNN